MARTGANRGSSEGGLRGEYSGTGEKNLKYGYKRCKVCGGGGAKYE